MKQKQQERGIDMMRDAISWRVVYVDLSRYLNTVEKQDVQTSEEKVSWLRKPQCKGIEAGV